MKKPFWKHKYFAELKKKCFKLKHKEKPGKDTFVSKIFFFFLFAFYIPVSKIWVFFSLNCAAVKILLFFFLLFELLWSLICVCVQQFLKVICSLGHCRNHILNIKHMYLISRLLHWKKLWIYWIDLNWIHIICYLLIFRCCRGTEEDATLSHKQSYAISVI